MNSVRLSLLVMLAVLLLSSCTLLATQEPSASTIPTPVPTPSPEATATLPPTPLPRLVTLIMWVPDFLNPYEDATGAVILNEQLADFAQVSPDVQVQIVVKKAEGAGGLYSMVSTAYAAAPSILPDLIILNQDDLRAAISGGLVQPLDAVPAEDADFFPFLEDSRAYGMPYVTQAEQMVYRNGISATPPLTWTAVLTGGYGMLFPAAPADGLAEDALLAAYLGAGGAVIDEDGKPTLERAELEQLYRFFGALMDARLIDPSRALELADAAACWGVYQQGVGRLSPAPAGQYWANPPQGSFPSWMPTADGEPITIAHVWSLAVMTSDPYRQEAALALARWLTEPKQMADFARATQLLPARFEAIEFWGLLPEELTFLERFLGGAVPDLPPMVDQPVRRALQAGLRALLKGDVDTPEAAATYALTNLR